MSLGKLAYNLYFRPTASFRSQGIIDATLAKIGKQELNFRIQKYLNTSSIELKHQEIDRYKPAITYLGGDRNVDLIYISLCSLYMNWSSPPPVFILSDGMLSKKIGSSLANIFPGVTPVYKEEIQETLDDMFPRHRFPNLRSLRDNFILIRKLLDVYSICKNWTLFIDADTVFLKTPSFLQKWFDNPEYPLYLLDHKNSYSYDLELMNQVSGTPVPQKVNTGLFALNQQLIDWEKVEYWYKSLLGKSVHDHFREQSLIAIILGSINNTQSLPSSEYICHPSKSQAINKVGIFHHYVNPCRYLFYGYVWRDILSNYSIDPQCIAKS